MDPVELKAGDLVNTSFRIWGNNLVPFTLLSILFSVPSVILALIIMPQVENIAADDFGDLFGQLFSMVAIIGLVEWIFNVLLVAAITVTTVETLAGRKVSIGDSLSRGFNSWLPALGTGLAVGIIVGIGTLLLFIPGIIAATILAVAVPAAVIEGKGGISRSAHLTEGYRMKIFWTWVLLGLVFIGIGIAVGIPMAFIYEAIGDPTVQMILESLINAIFGTVVSIMPAVFYQRLREIKEDVSVDELVAVFE